MLPVWCEPGNETTNVFGAPSAMQRVSVSIEVLLNRPKTAEGTSIEPGSAAGQAALAECNCSHHFEYCSATVSVASADGVSASKPFAGGTPAALAGEDACATQMRIAGQIRDLVLPWAIKARCP